MDKVYKVYLRVETKDPHILARAMETLGKAGTGLALEGVEVWISIGPDEMDD